jgi:hypothetical protein
MLLLLHGKNNIRKLVNLSEEFSIARAMVICVIFVIRAP